MTFRSQRRPGGRQILPRPAQWRELEYAPWTNLDTSGLADVDMVRQALSARTTSAASVVPLDAQPSAVLVALLNERGRPHVLLTRRSESLHSHKGQIAFPGGRIETGETSFAAALRETREEIGVDASDARRLGELSAHRTISSRSHIVPHVVELTQMPTRYSLNGEVERVFTVALDDLIRPDTFVQEHWVFSDREVIVPIFYLDDETIWGATARMLQELLLLAIARS